MERQGEDIKIKKFLLGSLEPPDADEIGVRIIADRALDEKMSAAEDELIEEFLDDALSAEEKELFLTNFLTTPERIELLEETALLKGYAQNYFKKDAERFGEEKKSEGFFEKFGKFLSLNLRPIAAVLVILILAGAAWRIFLYDAAGGLTETEQEYAALNAKDLAADAAETANLSSKNLAAGTFRNTNPSAKLNAGGLTEKVFFRLALPPETAATARFNLELVKDGQTVFRQTDLRVYQNASGQELKVILPRTVLSRGNFQIKLNTGASYDFAVE